MTSKCCNDFISLAAYHISGFELSLAKYKESMPIGSLPNITWPVCLFKQANVKSPSNLSAPSGLIPKYLIMGIIISESVSVLKAYDFVSSISFLNSLKLYISQLATKA